MNERDRDTVLAYRLFFSSQPGNAVLRDLMKFCHFRTEIKNDVEEGERRVFLRILTLSKCSDEQLMALFAGQQTMMMEQDQT